MQRNILFIAIDDLRPELNCFGKNKLVTPHIDTLAAEGARFSRTYCQYPQCMPSRAITLSGVRPDDTRRVKIHQFCPHGEPSLPHYFKKNGYRTVSVGKVYHYNDDDADAWDTRYTNTFYEQEQGFGPHGYCSGYQLPQNKRLMENYAKGRGGPVAKLPPICECTDAPDDAYPDGVVAKTAVQELSSRKETGQPWFLAVGFYRPHLPWAVPQKYWDRYNRDEVDLADNPFFPEGGIGKTTLCDFMHYGDIAIAETYSDFGKYSDDDFPVLGEAKQRECVHGYWASVSFMDAQVGRVLEALEKTGQKENTVIVLWGDNGWHLGEHKLWSKVTTFEESSRVPLLISAPGITSGQTSAALTELVDIYPTLCDLCGLEHPGHLEGLSMAPLLTDPDRPWKKAIFSRVGNIQTLRTDRYRFTRFPASTPEGDTHHIPSSITCELFDHANDPKENVNIAGLPENAQLIHQLGAMLSNGWRTVLPDKLHSGLS